MILFFTGIAILIGGYFTYGRWIERMIHPTDARTPAVQHPDGVDYVVLPHWKNMLIQLLNIAGLGPVVGLILGIKFGAIVFILLPIGNIIGGAVHDYLAGMMSVRHNGANLPKLVNIYLGRKIGWVFSCFIVLMLALVAAVFINVPANLLIGESLLNNPNLFWGVVVAIFAYYAAATLFSVDQIIGRIYPLFGGLLLVATGALFGSLCWHLIGNPSLLTPNAEFLTHRETAPIVPVLFVTIACGIISGFHATQSPIIARTMCSERLGKQSFYGMMVLEGLIAMVWGGVGMAIYNLRPELMCGSEMRAISELSSYFLGDVMGAIAILGVVILAVTSGDTATRCLRLTLAEMLKMNQIPIRNRLIICIPVFAVIIGLLLWSNQSVGIGADLEIVKSEVVITELSPALAKPQPDGKTVISKNDRIVGIVTPEMEKILFSETDENPIDLIYGREKSPVTLLVRQTESEQEICEIKVLRNVGTFSELWRYFAWSNQVLAAGVLMMAAVWLFKQGKFGWVALMPGSFMTFIVVTFILWNPIGLNLPLVTAYWLAGILTLLTAVWVRWHGAVMRRQSTAA